MVSCLYNHLFMEIKKGENIMGFKKLFANIVISALFVFAIMSFIIIVQIDNGANEKITDNELINSSYTHLSGNLTNVQSTGQASLDTFGTSPPERPLGELDVSSVVAPTKLFRGMSIGTYNVLIRLPMILLGVSPIVASVISSIIILLIIIGIWAIWKGAIPS